jgi:hypothetical protein
MVGFSLEAQGSICELEEEMSPSNLMLVALFKLSENLDLSVLF